MTNLAVLDSNGKLFAPTLIVIDSEGNEVSVLTIALDSDGNKVSLLLIQIVDASETRQAKIKNITLKGSFN